MKTEINYLNCSKGLKSWLFTHDHKQIKCFHYVEGLGRQSLEKFNRLMDDFRNTWFNKETIKFFKEKCNGEDFFGEDNEN